MMSSVSFASVACLVLLVLLGPGTLGDRRFLQDSIGRRVWPKTADIDVAAARDIARRDSENTSCTMYSNEYDRKLTVLGCDARYVEAVQKEMEDSTCGNPFGAEEIAACGTNHNGTLCALLDLGYSYTFDYVWDSCFNRSDDGINRLPSADYCGSRCVSALRRLSDEFGCCIHATEYLEIVLTPSLWTNCGVQRPEACADSPKFEVEDTPPCSYEYSMMEYLYTYCKYLGRELGYLNMECGYSEQKTLEMCGYDKGKYCYLSNPAAHTSLAIYDKCHSFFEESTTDSVCTDECKEAIQDFKNLYGCCVISFNDTYDYQSIEPQILNSGLWASCGIEIPQDCTASSLAQLRPPDDSPKSTNNGSAAGGPDNSLKCTNNESAAVPVMLFSTLLVIIMIGLVISVY